MWYFIYIFLILFLGKMWAISLFDARQVIDICNTTLIDNNCIQSFSLMTSVMYTWNYMYTHVSWSKLDKLVCRFHCLHILWVADGMSTAVSCVEARILSLHNVRVSRQTTFEEITFDACNCFMSVFIGWSESAHRECHLHCVWYVEKSTAVSFLVWMILLDWI